MKPHLMFHAGCALSIALLATLPTAHAQGYDSSPSSPGISTERGSGGRSSDDMNDSTENRGATGAQGPLRNDTLENDESDRQRMRDSTQRERSGSSSGSSTEGTSGGSGNWPSMPPSSTP